MKAERPWPRALITDKGAAALRQGHPWVYAGEVVLADGCVDGDICDVYTQKGKYMGSGFFNSRSLLRVRVISANANDLFDAAFWRRRLFYAVRYRLEVMGEDASSCRLIFGDADQFPGLTVDRFGKLLVAEVQSLGIDCIKDLLFPLLVEVLEELSIRIDGLYERSQGPLREKEGLSERAGFYPLPGLPLPDSATIIILENGVRYMVDVAKGQKTGFFLDQKYNRLAVSRLAQGKKVLDCFSHTGSFAICCALAGALSVHCIDASREALACAEENAALNGVTNRLTFERADALKWLPEQVKDRRKYDIVILDPPAFAKSRKDRANAARAYRDINRWGMQLLNRGGYLATASCSHHMPREAFMDAIACAARDAGVRLRQVEERSQAPDHPVLWGVPETAYLKFFIFQVV